MIATFGTALSREDMKGFRGGDAGSGICSFFGTCTNSPIIAYDPDDPASGAAAQKKADDFCCANNCCTNADCPGQGTTIISSC